MMWILKGKRQMSAQTNTITDRRIKVLNDFYEIKGDGIAHARIDQLKSSKEFRASVNNLASANLIGKPKK
ncbi:hypothetical protein AUP74_00665 [Microbulbifer aggregans]|uniref:Uncharacterized protein n=1 Tax=Microbulbifer aggregans TaxID=1769779 RepID=A0A1C9W4Q4_9GAMM|nr:hypothetical protein AUP74_00665 [Microbulbifer aggregans]